MVIELDGVRFRDLKSWQITYAAGSPTDAWQVTLAAARPQLSQLHSAHRATLLHEGVRLRGTVDDVTVSLDENGLLAELTGRGPGGVLMDNDAMPAGFVQAGLDDILAAFVTPLGIPLEQAAALPVLADYTVNAGDSCYAALAGYTRWAAGITPRFSPEGGLILLPPGSGARHSLTAVQPILRASVCRSRYGVISRLVQIDSRTGAHTVYAGADDTGARRVVLAAEGCRASGQSPQQRIAQSAKNRLVLDVTLAGLFWAMADDVVEVRLP